MKERLQSIPVDPDRRLRIQGSHWADGTFLPDHYIMPPKNALLGVRGATEAGWGSLAPTRPKTSVVAYPLIGDSHIITHFKEKGYLL
jgi:hypothetical protein